MYKRQQLGSADISKVKSVLTSKKIKEIQGLLANIYVEPQMMKYITDIVVETRNNGNIYLGGSPRASLAILRTARVTAAINGRDFVIPDDIQYVAPHVLNHRIILTPDAEMEGLTPKDVLAEIIKTLEVPR